MAACFPLQTGASCSELTTSLVNHSLKFQMKILQIHCYFFVEKITEYLLFETDI